MKKTIKGTTYDTDKDRCLAEKADPYGVSWSLRQTRSGKLYINESRTFIGGKPKPYNMDIETFVPGCIIRDPKPCLRDDVEQREFVKPITRDKALAWCIRTQMPRTFHKELARFLK